MQYDIRTLLQWMRKQIKNENVNNIANQQYEHMERRKTTKNIKFNQSSEFK